MASYVSSQTSSTSIDDHKIDSTVIITNGKKNILPINELVHETKVDGLLRRILPLRVEELERGIAYVYYKNGDLCLWDVLRNTIIVTLPIGDEIEWIKISSNSVIVYKSDNKIDVWSSTEGTCSTFLANKITPVLLKARNIEIWNRHFIAAKKEGIVVLPMNDLEHSSCIPYPTGFEYHNIHFKMHKHYLVVSTEDKFLAVYDLAKNSWTVNKRPILDFKLVQIKGAPALLTLEKRDKTNIAALITLGDIPTMTVFGEVPPFTLSKIHYNEAHGSITYVDDRIIKTIDNGHTETLDVGTSIQATKLEKYGDVFLVEGNHTSSAVKATMIWVKKENNTFAKAFQLPAEWADAQLHDGCYMLFQKGMDRLKILNMNIPSTFTATRMHGTPLCKGHSCILM